MTNIAKSVPLKLRAYIMHWDDERSLGNSLIISLNHGRKFTNDPFNDSHVLGFDTVKEVVDELRRTVKCECKECLTGLAEELASASHP